MAGSELNFDRLTLGEITKRTGNGSLLTIADVLAAQTPVLEDAHWTKANMDTYHLYSTWLEEPTGEWTALNTGVSTYAGRTKPGEEGIGMLEAYSFVDARLISKVKDKKRVRSQEDMAFVRGLTKTFGTGMLYGNTATEPRGIDGWATRFWDPTNQDNVYDNGGDGSDCASVYIVQWGPEMCYLIYPEGGNTSLDYKDLGLKMVYDSNNKPYECHVSHFMLQVGFVPHDQSSIQRVGSIETAGATNIFRRGSLN